MNCKFCNRLLLESKNLLDSKSNILLECNNHNLGVKFFKHTSNSAKKVYEGYTFNNREIYNGYVSPHKHYIAQFHITENNFVLYFDVSTGHEKIIRIDHMPPYTPENFEDKIKTLLVFS